MVDGAALEKRCAKAPRVRIPPSPPPGFRISRERSPSGLWRRTGNAVRGNPSRVRIPPSPPSPRATPAADAVVGASAPSLTHPEMRSLRCSAPPWPRPPARRATSCTAQSAADAVVGASAPSLMHPEMRSLWCSAPPWPRPPAPRATSCTAQPAADAVVGAPGVSFPSRARRGTSGALYLQSAPAGLNSLPRSPLSNAARRCDVEDRVPRSGEPRTVSGPEGSSTKRSSSGAAERPGPSRSSWWAREFPGRRRVHGTANPLALDRRTS